MTCPVCGEKTKVVDSRFECESVTRRRECLVCGYRFSTIELEKDLLGKIIRKEDKHILEGDD